MKQGEPLTNQKKSLDDLNFPNQLSRFRPQKQFRQLNHFSVINCIKMKAQSHRYTSFLKKIRFLIFYQNNDHLQCHHHTCKLNIKTKVKVSPDPISPGFPTSLQGTPAWPVNYTWNPVGLELSPHIQLPSFISFMASFLYPSALPLSHFSSNCYNGIVNHYMCSGPSFHIKLSNS